MRLNALQAFAVWMGLVAVFGIFWTLLKAGAGEPEDDGPDAPPPPPSGA